MKIYSYSSLIFSVGEIVLICIVQIKHLFFSPVGQMSKVNHYFTPPLQGAFCTLTSRCQYFTLWYIGLHDRQTKGNNTPKDIMKYIILIKIMFSFNYIFPKTQCAAQELFCICISLLHFCSSPLGV